MLNDKKMLNDIVGKQDNRDLCVQSYPNAMHCNTIVIQCRSPNDFLRNVEKISMKKLFRMEKIHSTILSMNNHEIPVLGLHQIHQCLCNSN